MRKKKMAKVAVMKTKSGFETQDMADQPPHPTNDQKDVIQFRQQRIESLSPIRSTAAYNNKKKDKDTKTKEITQQEWEDFVNQEFSEFLRRCDIGEKLNVVNHIISLLEEEGGANSLEVAEKLKGLQARIKANLEAEIAASNIFALIEKHQKALADMRGPFNGDIDEDNRLSDALSDAKTAVLKAPVANMAELTAKLKFVFEESYAKLTPPDPETMNLDDLERWTLWQDAQRLTLSTPPSTPEGKGEIHGLIDHVDLLG